MISLNVQNILFALKENVIHRCSKPEDPSAESSPPWFGLPTEHPRWHQQKEEAVPHLDIEDNRSPLRSARLIQGDQKITS
jgi:hypothetical protein